MDDEKKCPFCAETIKQAAILCRHCGSNLAGGAEKHVKARSGVLDGVRLGFGMFIVLPLLVCIVVGVFFAFNIAGQDVDTIARVPNNSIHAKYVEMAQNTAGRKAAEKYCGDCHNQSRVQFPEGHPVMERCLYCHKV